MKKTSLILLFLFAQTMAFAQLDKKYAKFLIIKSQAIDYYPVWGKTDQYINLNLMSKEWRMYDLQKSVIQEGSYIMHPLGINKAENYTVVNSKKDIQKLEKNQDWKPREIVDKANRKITLEMEGFNAALFIEYEKGKKEKIMDIRGNAHSLAVSPSGKYLACIFEMSGLMIFDIEQEIEGIKKRLNQPIERFTKSMQKVEAKDLIGTWVAKSMEIYLEGNAAKSEEDEYRNIQAIYASRSEQVKDKITIDFLADGIYKMEMIFEGEKGTGSGTWKIEAGKVELGGTNELFDTPLSVDLLQNTLRLSMRAKPEKPFVTLISFRKL